MTGFIISSLFTVFIFWILVCLIWQPIQLRLFDGWGRLYKEYQSSEHFTGKVCYPFYAACRGDFGTYKPYTFPAIKIGADKENLHIAFTLPLLIGWEWVAIPWHDIDVKKRIANPSNELTFKGATGVSLLITTNLLRHLEQTSGKYWPT